MRRDTETAVPPRPPRPSGGFVAPPHAERDAALAEAGRAFAETCRAFEETCRAATEALRRITEMWRVKE